ncbi:DUF6266 family protein [Pedobacter nyackensis]|uniref:Uncharacterized protein n=1 Tax=Pedobacter nyackensis TaxID=475255 RepID=A0A1W2AR20_9SPHI|nr:DUF6266 family protein [Pedobacter nyackensis]SMC63166.1 hypothetical protein SAMN04488101_101867 [Pedobacter nyackensis]
MAIAKNGPHGEHCGRIGNVVYYMLNGKLVSRKIGRSTKPPTLSQLSSRLETKICSEFISRIQDVINIGFGIEMQGTDKNAFNLAVAYNKKNMFSGVYPDFKINYDLLILSKGILMPAQNPQVLQTEAGIQYTWDTDLKMAFPESTDQVMMLAYFPKAEKVFYTLFGSDRSSGTALLPIPASLKNQYMETYISFASADRKQLADSAYTGAFNKQD